MLYHQTYLPLHRWRVQLEDRYFRVSISVTPQLRTALPPGKAISAVQLSRPLPLSPSLSRALLSCYPTLPGQIHWWWIVNSASLLFDWRNLSSDRAFLSVSLGSDHALAGERLLSAYDGGEHQSRKASVAERGLRRNAPSPCGWFRVPSTRESWFPGPEDLKHSDRSPLVLLRMGDLRRKAREHSL